MMGYNRGNFRNGDNVKVLTLDVLIRNRYKKLDTIIAFALWGTFAFWECLLDTKINHAYRQAFLGSWGSYQGARSRERLMAISH